MRISLKAMFCVLATLGATLGASSAHAAASPPAPPNVILLTLDGVRWQEVFHGADQGQSLDPDSKVFGFLLGELAKQGPLYGDRKRGDSATVSNKALNSLPGYQSIMAGATQPCLTNQCGRIQVETFPERLVRELGLKPAKVATIASWQKIADAVEHVAGATFVEAGAGPGTAETPPWKDARYDKDTFARAIAYLKTNRPRFLFISLNDSDEWGHKGDYAKYLATLRQHDAWLKELVSTLDSMGEYGKQTTLLVTTDHGRGDDNEWGEHGSGVTGSGSVWFYGRSPYSRATAAETRRALAAAKSKAQFTHLDIRPTVEALFGLEPAKGGGKVIRSLVGDGSK